MTDLTLNQSLAVSLYQSDEKFPVHLEVAWQWLGYSRKDVCLDAIKRYLEEEIDFSISIRKSTGGRPKQDVRLSIDGLKTLGMIAGTEQGKSVRRYFLECERIAKMAIATTQPQLPSITNAKLTQLTTEKEVIRTKIKELRQLL
ncbi:MAG: hypothetical protein V7K64_13540 [Nostoc sp.]|uniref:hypothetical protein n=1 Tax=Nostoc sp. TaxID=1180 RepID=UPI002FF35FD8